jgi:hypothetical protein
MAEKWECTKNLRLVHGRNNTGDPHLDRRSPVYNTEDVKRLSMANLLVSQPPETDRAT